MRIIIDGVSCESAPGEFVKTVADRNNISIPSLCHHSALPGLAACRLCVVEVTPSGGKTQVVTSCVYPASDGLEVSTKSERILRLRKTILKLLISRAPKAEGRLKEYCEQYGVVDSFKPADFDESCILCGLCVKACDELGNSAIATVMRGIQKQVQTAFDEAPHECIGCASCAKVCPTGKIIWSQDDGSRTIWNKCFELVRCSCCGKPFATSEELTWLTNKSIDQNIDLSLCPTCRARKTAKAAISPVR